MSTLGHIHPPTWCRQLRRFVVRTTANADPNSAHLHTVEFSNRAAAEDLYVRQLLNRVRIRVTCEMQAQSSAYATHIQKEVAQ